LTAHILDEALGAGVAQSEPNSADSSRIAGWLSQQEAKYDLLIYEAEAEPSNWTRRCIRQADRVLIVAEGAANPEPGQIELEILGLEEAHISPSCELVLLYPDRNRQPVNTYRWLASRRVIRHHHLDLNAEADFDRLVRFLTGNAIGIVFSGGLFRGFAHGGVIRALEEAKIRADFVGGTSIGAAIGALYAMEWPFEKLLQRGKAFAAGARSYIDFTLPLVSLISSGKLTRLTQELYGETRIEDLWTNYFCVSGNLTTAQAMIHRQGPLWRYVRASYSLPTVMPPVPDNGEILVDGSLFNNLPADTMRDLCEGGPVIAVNVSPKKELPKQYKFDEKISAQRLLWSRFNPFVEELKAPSLLSTLMRSMVIGREETWPQAARDIDLYIEPPVVQFDLGDISSLDKIIEASYQAATVEIESWQKKLRERGILR
jgi:NTE family protein/lysophospholipid hydrolase